mmetsp:Transcript_8954/g.25086  ORF Transcript_8954/g.25086 Transcript_8954/m.25086 type:complete len:218 (-) Transcript_8954:31-684(-)
MVHVLECTADTGTCVVGGRVEFVDEDVVPVQLDIHLARNLLHGVHRMDNLVEEYVLLVLDLAGHVQLRLDKVAVVVLHFALELGPPPTAAPRVHEGRFLRLGDHRRRLWRRDHPLYPLQFLPHRLEKRFPAINLLVVQRKVLSRGLHNLQRLPHPRQVPPNAPNQTLHLVRYPAQLPTVLLHPRICHDCLPPLVQLTQCLELLHYLLLHRGEHFVGC